MPFTRNPRIVPLAVAGWVLGHICGPAIVHAQLPYVPDSATVALYHLDDESDSTVVDSSPNGLDAHVYGATQTPAGYFGGAYTFDGDDHIRIPNSDLTFTPSATYEAWVYLTAPASTEGMVIIEKVFPLDEAAGRGLCIGGDGKAWAYAIDIVPRIAKGSTTIPLGEWVHLAAVFDDPNSVVQVAVDGVVEAEAAMSSNSTTWNLEIAIGRSTLQRSRFFRGKIDEVRISNRARSVPTALNVLNWTDVKTLWR